MGLSFPIILCGTLLFVIRGGHSFAADWTTSEHRTFSYNSPAGSAVQPGQPQKFKRPVPPPAPVDKAPNDNQQYSSPRPEFLARPAYNTHEGSTPLQKPVVLFIDPPNFGHPSLQSNVHSRPTAEPPKKGFWDYFSFLTWPKWVYKKLTIASSSGYHFNNRPTSGYTYHNQQSAQNPPFSQSAVRPVKPGPSGSNYETVPRPPKRQQGLYQVRPPNSKYQYSRYPVFVASEYVPSGYNDTLPRNQSQDQNNTRDSHPVPKPQIEYPYSGNPKPMHQTVPNVYTTQQPPSNFRPYYPPVQYPNKYYPPINPYPGKHAAAPSGNVNPGLHALQRPGPNPQEPSYATTGGGSSNLQYPHSSPIQPAYSLYLVPAKPPAPLLAPNYGYALPPQYHHQQGSTNVQQYSQPEQGFRPLYRDPTYNYGVYDYPIVYNSPAVIRQPPAGPADATTLKPSCGNETNLLAQESPVSSINNTTTSSNSINTTTSSNSINTTTSTSTLSTTSLTNSTVPPTLGALSTVSTDGFAGSSSSTGDTVTLTTGETATETTQMSNSTTSLSPESEGRSLFSREADSKGWVPMHAL